MFSTLGFLEAEATNSKNKPHMFQRKEIVRDFGSMEFESFEMGLRDEVENKWPLHIFETLRLNSCSSFTEIKQKIWFDNFDCEKRKIDGYLDWVWRWYAMILSSLRRIVLLSAYDIVHQWFLLEVQPSTRPKAHPRFSNQITFLSIFTGQVTQTDLLVVKL